MTSRRTSAYLTEYLHLMIFGNWTKEKKMKQQMEDEIPS
jgi:hypothetical protein